MKVFILAGGEGKRLRPYTYVLPKPLLPIGEQPILDRIFENLKKQNIKDIFLAVNYKDYLFKMIYGDGSKIGLNITYINESKPLGTAGSLSILNGKILEPFFVTNGDVICNLDLNKLEEFHKKNGCDITVVTRKISTQINFGVLQIEEDKILGWREKPKIESEISAGMYMLNPEVLKCIPEDNFFNMPDLFQKVIEHGGKVRRFLYEGEISDVSDLTEYEKIRSNFNNN